MSWFLVGALALLAFAHVGLKASKLWPTPESSDGPEGAPAPKLPRVKLVNKQVAHVFLKDGRVVVHVIRGTLQIFEMPGGEELRPASLWLEVNEMVKRARTDEEIKSGLDDMRKRGELPDV